MRRELFEKLLQIENDIKDKLDDKKLIIDEEILQIQKEWERDGDFLNSAIEIAKNYGKDIKYSSFNALEKEEKNICYKYNLIPDFINKSFFIKRQRS